VSATLFDTQALTWFRPTARRAVVDALERCGVPESRSGLCADDVLRSLIEVGEVAEAPRFRDLLQQLRNELDGVGVGGWEEACWTAVEMIDNSGYLESK
jgi:hypothetical protein